MNDVVQAEIINGIKEIQELNNNEFSKTNEAIKKVEEAHEKLAFEDKIPEKDIAKKVSLTQIEIDLGLASLAKSTALKLVKLEKYLSKIEDIIYNDETLTELDKGKLLQLYSQTRIMRSELLKSLTEIRSKIDFETLNAQIQALNIQNERNEISSLDEIVNKILENENFLNEVQELQKSKIDEIKNNKGENND